MFDLNEKSEKTKFDFLQDLYNPSSLAVEEILPIDYIKNGILYQKDGSKTVFLTFPGKNLSLITDDEKEDYAEENSKVLSGITAETAGIFWIPERTDSNANLSYSRRRIQELEQKIFHFKGPEMKKECLRRQLLIMENYILKDIQQKAVGRPTVQGRTYLALKFNAQKEPEINNSIKNTQKRIQSATGKESHWLINKEDILDFLDNWINCYIPTNREHLPKIIMPSYVTNR